MPQDDFGGGSAGETLIVPGPADVARDPVQAALESMHHIMGRLEGVAASLEGQVLHVSDRIDDLGKSFVEHTHLAAPVEAAQDTIEEVPVAAEETVEAPAEAAVEVMPETEAVAIPQTAPVRRNRYRLRGR